MKVRTVPMSLAMGATMGGSDEGDDDDTGDSDEDGDDTDDDKEDKADEYEGDDDTRGDDEVRDGDSVDECGGDDGEVMRIMRMLVSVVKKLTIMICLW